MRSLLALVLLLVATVTTAVYRYNHDASEWPPDAAIYLRMTLEDRGFARDEARARADAFLRARVTQRASARVLREPAGVLRAAVRPFRTRPLFAHVAALLYPRFGSDALRIVSVAAYVLAAGVMFAILSALVPPWLAALGAFSLATAPPVLGLAALGLTDVPALLLWLISLGAILAYVRRPSRATLAVVALASLLLTFTRPAAFLPLGASLGAVYALRRDPRGRRAMAALVATTAAAAVAFVVYSAIVHGPGLADQLRWEYDWQRSVGGAEHGFAPWYAFSLVRIVGDALTFDVYEYGAVLGLVLAALGIVAARRSPLVPVLVGAACASVVALLADPLEFIRTVELPLVPVVVIFGTLALNVLARAIARQEAPGETAP